MSVQDPSEVIVRLYQQDAAGDWHDYQRDYGLEDFAGIVPSIGDKFLEPGVLQGLDRYQAVNRRLYTVVERFFNPRDLTNYVVLVVTESVPTGREASIVSPR